MKIIKKIAVMCLVGMLAANIHGDDIVNPVEWTRHYNSWNYGARTTVVLIEGHRYVIACVGAHGVCVVHAHSCPCMAGK